ncbi:MAG: cation-translocating P-type ATPase [bacterium]
MNRKNAHSGLASYEPQVPWHTIEADRTMEILGVSREGLKPDEARKRLDRFGPNSLPRKGAPPLVEVFIRQFKNPLIYILLLAGTVSGFIDEYADAVFIMVVVLLNAIIGTMQEYKSEKSAAELEEMLRTRVKVRRDGSERQIDADELVPGDRVLLETGALVPSDIRLVERQALSVNESILTGESVAVSKQIEALRDEDLEPSDQTNMVFAGTTVMAGRAEGVVVRTGLRTELGKISEVVSGAEMTKPPLVIRMDRFVKRLSFVILAAVLILGVVSALQGAALTEVFFMAVALAVSAIPEGMPVATTVALAVGLNRMAGRNVIIRRLTAVEGLGSCTYILSDKTGTLTMNRQTARVLSLPVENGYQRYHVSGEGYSGEGEIIPEGGGKEIPEQNRLGISEMIRGAVLANEGRLFHSHGQWRGEGDPIDVGFLALAYKAGEIPEEIRRTFRVTGRIPYESERKLAGAFYEDRAGESRVMVKGAVEAILPICSSMLYPGREITIDLQGIKEEAEQLARQGYRVLAVASGEGGAPEASDEEISEEALPAMKFLGLAGFIDPLRPEVKDAVDECREAGVRVAMITGDHPDTALAIARNLGIAESRDDLLTGAELKHLEREGSLLEEQVEQVSVFARMSPMEKLRIVEALARRGHFIAVTGDGVNDAPALRRAHVGVAMGSGTDVAKQTGSIIITDDNFASIVSGIEEGRRAYQNFRKVIYLLVATGAAEIILFMMSLLTGSPLPLVAVQLLWLNLVTNGIQDVALAFERGEPDFMKRPPRDPDEPIFNRLLIQETIVTAGTMSLVAFGIWWWLLRQGLPLSEGRNLILLLMVFFENFHAFNCRSEEASAFQVPWRSNLFLVIAIPAALGIHVLSLYLPFLRKVLGTEPVSLSAALILLVCASTVLMASEIFKHMKRSTHTSDLR